MKTCKKCKKQKETKDFSKSACTTDKLNTTCKECNNAKDRLRTAQRNYDKQFEIF